MLFKNNKQPLKRLSSLALLLSCFINPSQPAKAETYIVGLQNFDYYPHYNFTSDQDRGFIWAVLELYASESGHTFIYQTMPVPRLQIELAKGTVDLIYPDNPIFHPGITESTEKHYSVDVVKTLSGAIIKHTNVNMEINEVSKVSLPFGFTPLDWKGKEKNGDIDFVETEDSLSALQLVEQGKTDVAEVDYFVTSYLSEANPTIGQFTLSPVLPHNIVGFKLASIKQHGLIKQINDFLAGNESRIDELKLKYGIHDPENLIKDIQSTYVRSE